jgi:hypothetical protein
MIYEEVTTDNGNTYVKRTGIDGVISWIPMDPANVDYQAYLNRDNPDWGKPLL